jgi:hypothetical protein|tara:strand:- start:302 stop:1132 length:831 start_codon:yes stop_codon:yes gene_type:complete
MIDRKELIEEQVLRENIRKAIKIVRENKKTLETQEEDSLRGIIRKMINEGKTPVADDAPHEKTGINYLRTTLKKIIPSIKDAYMSLTTDEEQRKSYIAHLINGMDNLLAPLEVNAAAAVPDGALGESDLEEEVEVSIGNDEDEFIDIGDIGLEDEEEVEEEDPEDEDLTTMTTGMDDDEHDETGRNAALATFKQVQGNIIDDFEQLAADEDRELYHDYLKTNILLWRDKFEDALSPNMPEPTTPEYEAEVGNDQDAGIGGDLESGEEEEEFDIGGL